MTSSSALVVGWVEFIMIIKCERRLQSEAVRGADTNGSVCFLPWREQLDIWLFILEVQSPTVWTQRSFAQTMLFMSIVHFF